MILVAVCTTGAHSRFSLATDEVPTTTAQVDYLRHIKPVLRDRCFACHGALKQEAGLRLDTAQFVTRGSDSGAIVTPEQPDESPLLVRITSHDESDRMPPEGEPLTAEQTLLFRTWVAQGATGPADEDPESDPGDHWAFKTPVRPEIPTVVDLQWNAHPIDALIEASRQEKGLRHQAAADRRVWLRRVSLDLAGLPPTPPEIEAFVADESPQAYENIVTKLLDSPQYGERWGRHWMDIWRYSDWWGLGAEVRNSQKHIWHWRDWIIESLNADKGYDEMIREMLAADELYPNDLDRLRASGFLARQYFKFNRTSWLDETIEHTSKAMLGLTFNCAKCHDHKYDPIEQSDYYRLRAIFEPYQVRMDMLPGETQFERDGLPRAFDCNLDAPTYLQVRGDDRNPDKTRVMVPSVPSFLSQAAWNVEPVSLPAEAYQPGLRPFVTQNYLDVAEQAIVSARAELESALSKLKQSEVAEKLAAERPAAGNLVTEFVAKDNFLTERPEMWEQLSGKWSYENGHLVQSQDGAMRAAMRLKQAIPDNFEAKLIFQTTGGQRWKSVGITFDVVDQNEVLAYISGYADGPKSQIAYKTGDSHLYPAEAAQSRRVELNQPIELMLQVRGTLINLFVDGELSVAYRLPIERRPGALEIITFDGTAKFAAFELRPLPADVPMKEGKPSAHSNNAPLPVEQAQLVVRIAEKRMAVAEAQLPAIRARAAAQRAQHQQPAPGDAATLSREAVRLERLVAVSKAEELVLTAELEVAQTIDGKKPEAEAKLAAARAAAEAARLAVDTPAENFTPLSGSLKTLENNVETEESRNKPFPKSSTGRRSAFANWLTDRNHPLTARVAVNHIWMRHMGRPLVPTVFDFGRKGTPPTHPELLDWLAVELMENDWSMKHIHRLIVTSQAYRMSSSIGGASAETIAQDPDNKFYWHANPVRMEAQVIRDSLLHLAGELDLTLGGPSIAASNETSRRRSLYFVHSHNEHQKFLSMFDDASVLDCYRRAESIVPQQALALENSQLASEMAEKIDARISAANPDASDIEYLRAAFLTILSFEPSPDELALAADGLSQLTALGQQKNHPNPESRARISLVQALLNHNDFVTIR